MPRESAASLHAKAERDEARARQNKHKALVANVSHLMSKHPTIVPHLHDLAEKLASQDEFAGVSLKAPVTHKAPAKPVFQEQMEDGLTKSLEKYMWCLEKLPVFELKVIAYSINAAWTPWALMSLKTRATQREVPKEALLDLLEMATGVQRHFSLGHTYVRTIQDVATFLKGKAAVLGGEARLASIHIPPNWQIDGLYHLEVHSDELTVKQRFTNATFKISNGDPKFSWHEVSEVHLVKNFSYENSALQEGELPHTLLLREVFAVDGVLKQNIAYLMDKEPSDLRTPEPAGKRRRLAVSSPTSMQDQPKNVGGSGEETGSQSSSSKASAEALTPTSIVDESGFAPPLPQE